MATKHPDSAPRLGGVLISNQVVAELLEQLRNGIWQDTDHLPPAGAGQPAERKPYRCARCTE